MIFASVSNSNKVGNVLQAPTDEVECAEWTRGNNAAGKGLWTPHRVQLLMRVSTVSVLRSEESRVG